MKKNSDNTELTIDSKYLVTLKEVKSEMQKQIKKEAEKANVSEVAVAHDMMDKLGYHSLAPGLAFGNSDDKGKQRLDVKQMVDDVVTTMGVKDILNQDMTWPQKYELLVDKLKSLIIKNKGTITLVTVSALVTAVTAKFVMSYYPKIVYRLKRSSERSWNEMQLQKYLSIDKKAAQAAIASSPMIHLVKEFGERPVACQIERTIDGFRVVSVNPAVLGDKSKYKFIEQIDNLLNNVSAHEELILNIARTGADIIPPMDEVRELDSWLEKIHDIMFLEFLEPELYLTTLDIATLAAI